MTERRDIPITREADKTERLDIHDRARQQEGTMPAASKTYEKEQRADVGKDVTQLHDVGGKGSAALANRPREEVYAESGFVSRDLPAEGSRTAGGATRYKYRTSGVPGFFEVPEWESLVVHSQQVRDYDAFMNEFVFSTGAPTAEAAREAERLPEVMQRRNACLALCVQSLADPNKLKVIEFLTDKGEADRDYVRGSLQEGGFLRRLVNEGKITSAGITSNYLEAITERGWDTVLFRPGDFVWLGHWRVSNWEAAHRELPRLSEAWARQLGALSSLVFKDTEDEDFVWALHLFAPGTIDHAAQALEDMVKNPWADSIRSGALVPPIEGGFGLITHALDTNGIALVPYERLAAQAGPAEKAQTGMAGMVEKAKTMMGTK